MKALLAVIITLGLGSSIVPAQSDGMVVSKRFVIRDSGFAARWDVMGLPLWIDNKRLMFEGVDSETKQRHPLRPVHAVPYIWDTDTGEITQYRTHRIFQVCYSDGVIHYKVEDEKTKKWIVYKGPIGKEQRQTPSSDTSSIWNHYDCAPFSEAEEQITALRNAGRRIVRLRREHGYIDVGPIAQFHSRLDTADFDYQRYTLNGKWLLKLGIPRSASALPIQWMPFNNRYLFDDTSEGGRNHVWLVDLDGTAKRIALPQRDWNYPMKIIGVKGGVLMNVTHSSSTTPYSPGSQGLYLLSDAGFERILQGLATEIAVSPDGCKVSFILAPYTMALSEGTRAQRYGVAANTMQFIDLCQVR